MREKLQPGRDHLTVSGTFQSDKYEWCPAGFVPLKITDPMAYQPLLDYAQLRKSVDVEFTRDLLEALEEDDIEGNQDPKNWLCHGWPLDLEMMLKDHEERIQKIVQYLERSKP